MTEAAQPTSCAQRSLGRRALAGSVSQLAVQLTVVPIGAAILVYLTRRLGPATYGQYATVMAVLTWVEFALSSLLNRTIIKVVAGANQPEEAGVAMVRLAATLGVCGTGLLWLFRGPIAQGMHDDSLAPLVALGSLDVALFVTGSAYASAIAGLGKFGRRAAATSLRWPLRLALSVLMVERGWGAHGALWALIGASAGELLLCMLCCPLPLWRRAAGRREAFLGEAAPLFGSALALRALDGGDLLVLRALGASAADTGSYAAAMNLAMLPGLLAAAVCPILMASMVHVRAAGNEADIHTLSSMVIRIGAWLVPPAAAACLAGPALVAMVFGPSFETSTTLFQVLLWAGLARMAVSVACVMLAGAGRSAWAWHICAPLLPLAALGYLALIPRFGAMGAAWATAIASIAGAALALWYVHRRLGARLRGLTIAAVCLTTSAVVGLAQVWPLEGGAAVVYAVGATVSSLAAGWVDVVRAGARSLRVASSAAPGAGA